LKLVFSTNVSLFGVFALDQKMVESEHKLVESEHELVESEHELVESEQLTFLGSAYVAITVS
jgi:hypothetical protein